MTILQTGHRLKQKIKKYRILLIVVLFSLILTGCHHYCTSPACNTYIFYGPISGKEFVMDYSLIWSIDSLTYYSMNNDKDKFKISKFTLVEYFEDMPPKVFVSYSNKITDEMKNSIGIYHSRLIKLVFKDIIITDNNNNRVKQKIRRKFTVKYFPIENPD